MIGVELAGVAIVLGFLAERQYRRSPRQPPDQRWRWGLLTAAAAIAVCGLIAGYAWLNAEDVLTNAPPDQRQAALAETVTTANQAAVAGWVLAAVTLLALLGQILTRPTGGANA